MRRIRVAAALSISTTLGLAACSGSSGSSSSGEDEYRIVYVSGLSGPLAVPSQQSLYGIEAAAEALNAEGGILGRKVVVESLDSTGDPTRAVSALQKSLTDDGNPDLVVASISSNEALAMLPALTRAKILSISNASSPSIDEVATYPYHFGTLPSAVGNLAGFTEFLEGEGVSKLTAVLGEDAFGEGNLAAVTAALEGSDIELEVTRYNPADVDQSVPWERAAATSPDAIYMECFGDSCSRLLDGRVRANATGIQTIVGGGASGTGAGPVAYASPESLENLLMKVERVQIAKPADEQSDAYKSFLEKFAELNGGTIENSIYSGTATFDGVRAVAAAAEQADSTEVDDLVAALESLDTPEDYLIGYVDGFGYSGESHFPQPPPEQFQYIAPVPLVDGVFESN